MSQDDVSDDPTLPSEIVALRDLARKIVREELLPLEKEYIASPKQGMAMRARDALRAVFPEKTVDRLYNISRETGLWGIGIPEEHGGSALPLLAKAVIMEEFMYTAVPFPIAEVS